MTSCNGEAVTSLSPVLGPRKNETLDVVTSKTGHRPIRREEEEEEAALFLNWSYTSYNIRQLSQEINFNCILMCVIKYYKLFSVAPEFVWVNTAKFL